MLQKLEMYSERYGTKVFIDTYITTNIFTNTTCR